MAEKYPVITLCGSTRFRKEFETAQKQLTLQGCIVISVRHFGHTGDRKDSENINKRTKPPPAHGLKFVIHLCWEKIFDIWNL